MKDGQVVELQGEGREVDGQSVTAGEVERGQDGEIVVGMPEFGSSTALESRQGDSGLSRR